MKASRQFQKQSASSVTPISQTSKRLQTRPFRDPNAPTTAQSSQSSLPAYDYDPSSRPAWWDRLTFNPQRPSTVQAKLTVGAPNDVYEQEADRVADQVMSMPDHPTQQPIQRETAPEEEELQTKPIAASITPLVQRETMPEEEQALQTKASSTTHSLFPTPSIQREAMPEEEELQTKASENPDIQREDHLEEEEIQTKPLAGTLQREEGPEEEDLQMKALGNSSIQRADNLEEEEIQTKSLGNSSIQREDMPEEEEIQTKPSPAPDSRLPTPSLETQLSNTQGSGSPLPNDVRSFMEPRFGADFSQVRVHTGSDAVQMNRDLNAQAFTHKQDVYFGAGKTPGKDALTAHELTHVVQQTGGVQTELVSETLDVQQKCSACEKEEKTLQRSIRVSHAPESSIQRFDPIEYIPGVGKVWKTVKCAWKIKQFSDVMDECRKDYSRNCDEDITSDECTEFMDGTGYPSDAILNCTKKKAPDLYKDLLTNCAKAVVASYKK